MKHIEFDKEKLKRLKHVYEKAIELQQDSFWFEGNEYLTSYAKYLIEYLETKFKKTI